MCLTIPKKVLEIREYSVIVEDFKGDRQELKTMIKSLEVGDYVLSQQNVIIDKIEQEIAKEILNILQRQGE